jgi:uncharacterized protein YqjF (DUF2071 family)
VNEPLTADSRRADVRCAPSFDQRLAARTPIPRRPIMYQSWRELLFLHWRFPSEALQSRLPRGLHLDTHDGQAWVGAVPFFMRSIRPWWSPPIPGVSYFLELNLRTYVHDDVGRPGVWFFSLDANQRFGVWWGRTLFYLPYYPARMRADWNRRTGHVRFQSERRGAAPAQTCRFEYAPRGAASPAAPDGLEFFLVERYLLFAQNPRGRLFYGQVCHPPYEVSEVNLRHWDEHLFELAGLLLPGRPPDHAMLSRGVDVEVHPLTPVAPSPHP